MIITLPIILTIKCAHITNKLTQPQYHTTMILYIFILSMSANRLQHPIIPIITGNPTLLIKPILARRLHNYQP